MNNDLSFIGGSVPFGNICELYPPTINEVKQEKLFYQFKSILTMSQEDLYDKFVFKDGEFIVPNTIDCQTVEEYFFSECNNTELFKIMAEKAIEFFTKEKVLINGENKQIVFIEKLVGSEQVKLSDIKYIDEKSFFHFQNAVRGVLGEDPQEPPKENEHFAIARMRAKARYRDRIKARKNPGLTLRSSLVSICCMGMGLNPLNIGELPYSSVNLLMSAYQSKEKYEIDTSSILAGADPKKVKPKHWIKNY